MMWGDQADYDADPNTGTPVLDGNGDPIVGVLKILHANFEGCDKDSRKGKYNVYFSKVNPLDTASDVEIASIYDDTAGVETRGFFIGNALCSPTEPEPDPDQNIAFGCLAKDGCKEVEVVDASTDVGNLMYGDGTAGVAVPDENGVPITDARKLNPNVFSDPDEIYVVEDDGSITAVWIINYLDFNDAPQIARYEANSAAGCKTGFYIESDNFCLNPNEKPDEGALQGNLLGCLETKEVAAKVMWGQPGLGVPARGGAGGTGAAEIFAKRLLVAWSVDASKEDKIGQWTVLYEDSSGAPIQGFSPTGADDGTDDGFYLDVSGDECEDGGTETPDLCIGVLTGCKSAPLGSPVFWGKPEDYLAHQNPVDYIAAGIPVAKFTDGTDSDNVVRLFRPFGSGECSLGVVYYSLAILIDNSIKFVEYPDDGTLSFSPPDGFFLAQGLCEDGEDVEDGCTLEESITIKPEGCQSVTKDGGDLLWGKISAIDEDFGDASKYEVVDTNVKEILRVTTDDYCDNNYGVFTCAYLKDGDKIPTFVTREGFNPGNPVEDTEAFFLNPGSNKCADDGFGRPQLGDITGCRRTLDEAGTNLYWGSGPLDAGLTQATDEDGNLITDAVFIIAVISFDADVNKLGNWACIYDKADGTRGLSETVYGSSPTDGFLLEDDNCELEPCQGGFHEGDLPDCNEVDPNGAAGDLYWETGDASANVDIGVKARKVLATWTIDDCTEDPFDLATPKIWTALYLNDKGRPAVAGAELGTSPFGGYYIEVDDVDSFCAYDTTNPPGGACETDKDCPPGFICVGGICEQIRCSLDDCPGDDCNCPDGFICVQGICLRPCGVEGGPLCPDGSHCISVPDPNGGPDYTVCVPGPGCNGDCPEGYFCLDGECVILECSLNPDNSNDNEDNGCPPGYVCYNGQCLKPCDIDKPEPCPPGFQCIDTGTDGFLCFPIEGPCPPNPPIVGEDPCPPGYDCVLGACRKPCSDTEPCPEGFQCFNGHCFPEGPDFPNCTPDSCPEGYRCIGGICIPIFGCEEDSDCGGNFECFGGICRPICDPDEDPDPCPNGMECFDGLCYEKCDDTNPCPEGHHCVNGLCLPILSCDGVLDCPDGFECVDGTCRRVCDLTLYPDAEFPGTEGCPIGTKCFFGNCYPICTEDGDCPPGHKCLGGICIPEINCDPEGTPTGCPAGMDCVDGICRPVCDPDVTPDPCPDGFQCFFGHCFPVCTDETDCPDDHYCIGGKCIPMLECDGTSDCPSGMECIGGICRPLCPTDPDGTEGENGQCPDGFVCYNGVCYPSCTDKECPPGHICVEGICYPIVGCDPDAVPDTCPPGFSCAPDGTCRPECPAGTDEQCPDGFKCFEGHCYPSCDSAECPAGHECINGICLPPILCPDGQDDSCPGDWVCVNGICRPACPDGDTDCPDDMICVDGACWTPCTDGSCPEGFACVGGICRPIIGCGEDGDCPEGHICLNGVCVKLCDDDLANPNPCPPGFICTDITPDISVCLIGCNDNFPCPPGHICWNGVCWPSTECNDDNPCPEGYVCLNGTCVKECDLTDDDSCPPGFICTPTDDGNVCLLGCNETNDCPPGFACLDGKCVPQFGCSTDKPCPDGFECVNGICLPSCPSGNDTECPNGYECIDGICKKPCANTDECPPGFICVDGTCEPGGRPDGHCTDTTECPSGYECIDGRCRKVCDDDSSCPSNFICFDGHCLPVGRPEGPCGEEGCPPGYECILGICRKPCNGDDDCFINENCVDPPGACMPRECSDDNPCPAGTICIDGRCRIDCSDGTECPPGYICTPVDDGSICLPISPGPDGPDRPVEEGPLPHDKIGCEEVDISGTLYWGTEQDYIAGTGEAVIKDGAFVKARKIHTNFVTDLYPNGVGDYTCLYSEPGSDDIESVTLNRQSPLNGMVHSYYIDPDDDSVCINAGSTHDPVDGYISGCKETDRGGNLYWGTTAEALDPNQDGVKLFKDGVEIICKGIINVISIDSEDPGDSKPGQVGTWQIFYRTLDGGNDMVAHYGRSGPFGPEGAYMVAVEGSICIDDPFGIVTTRDVILVNSPRVAQTRQSIIGEGPSTDDIIGPNGETIKYNTQEQANVVFTDLLLHLDTYKPTVQLLTDINDAPDWYVPKKGDLWIDPSDYSIYVADLVDMDVPDPITGELPRREDIRKNMARYVAWIEIGGGGEAGNDAAKGNKVYYDESPHVPGSGPGSPDIAALSRGDLWIDSNTLITYVWNNTSESWIDTTGDLNAIFDNRFEVAIQPNAPTKEFTKSGDLWFDSEFGEMRIAYVPAGSGGDFVWVPVQGTGLKAAPSKSSFSTEEEVDELRTQVQSLTARLDAIDSNY